MSRKANPTVVGLFTVGALGLLVVAVLVFGSGQFLSEKTTYVTYFDGSVKGLRVGAPVTFRGVKIGEVKGVRLLVDRKDLEVSIPVYFEIDPDSFHVIQNDGGTRVSANSHQHGEAVHSMVIEQGLRAQLQAQSLVTGQLQIEIDFHPDTEFVLKGIDPTIPEVPSIKSGMQQLVEKIEEIPLAEIARKASDALSGIESMVNSEDAKKTILSLQTSARHLEEILKVTKTDLPVISSELKMLIAKLNKHVDPVGTEARKVLENANVAMSNISDSTRRGSDFRVEVRQVLRDFSLAANSLRILAEQLERQPESILKGKTGGQK